MNQSEELEMLRAENAALKAAKPAPRALSMKLTDKGGVSVYGLGRFPVTLYPEQWQRLLGISHDIEAFLEANKAHFLTKEESKARAAELKVAK